MLGRSRSWVGSVRRVVLFPVGWSEEGPLSWEPGAGQWECLRGLLLWFAEFLIVPVGLDTCFSKSIPEVTMERSAKSCCLVFILRLAQSHSVTRRAVPKLSNGSSMSTGFVTQDYLE